MMSEWFFLWVVLSGAVVVIGVASALGTATRVIGGVVLEVSVIVLFVQCSS